MTDVKAVVFIVENNSRVLEATPPDKAITCVVAVPVEMVNGSPAYAFRPGHITVIAPPNLRKSDVTLIEHSVEIWAEGMRQAIDAARVQIIDPTRS